MADKVYELRFYNFNLSGASAYRKMINEKLIKARSKVLGPVLGPWEVQLNGFAEFFHIAVEDDLDHVLKGRTQIEGNEEIATLLQPVVDAQWTFRNYLTVLAPGTDLRTDFTPSDSAVYELQTVPEGSEQPTLDSKATLVGRFLTVYGPSKTEFRLIRYPDAASAQADAVARRADLPRGWENRVMEPLPVSVFK